MSEDSGGCGSDWYSKSPVISADGRVVAFQSGARNLVPPDPEQWDIFLFDSGTGTLPRVSPTTDGQQPNGPSFAPALSANGQLVVYMSKASNFDHNDPSDDWDVYLYDRVTDKIEWISPDIPGSTKTEATYPVISGDGRYVAYQATPDFGDGVYHQPRVNVFDRVARQVVAEFVGQSPLAANGFSPRITRDGNLIIVHAWNDDFVPDGFWGQGAQVFVRSANTWAAVAESAYSTMLAKSGNLAAFTSFDEGLVDDGLETDYSDVFVAARDPSLDPYLGARCGQ